MWTQILSYSGHEILHLLKDFHLRSGFIWASSKANLKDCSKQSVFERFLFIAVGGQSKQGVRISR
jgi:hypothetical protein